MRSAFAQRWDLLKPEEKRLVQLHFLAGIKQEAIARELGISWAGLKKKMPAIQLVLGVSSQVELALELGRHEHEIFTGEKLKAVS
jgi:DNA-binding CsgD family transcriptional regulator